jgi:glycosyltransferase involved in cell wall biosynthesis
MRIALVSRQMATVPHSGLSRASGELAAGLAALGHDVHVIAEQPAGLALPDTVAVHGVSGGRPLAWAAAAHAELERIVGLDVVSVPLWGSAGIFASRDPRWPTVVSCMTSATTIAALEPGWTEVAEHREAIRLERLALAGARHLHGLTRAVLDKTIADHALAPLTAGVVGRGLRDRAADVRPPSPHDGPVELLFVGRVESRKGTDVLLDAVRTLLADGVELRLTLVAPGAVVGGDARIRVEGPVSEARLHELYASADVVCQPSRYESHGVVLVEAMMYGRPLVTTTAGGIPEVVEDGGNALLAVPGDAGSLAAALRGVIDSAELRARMGARSRELYEARFEPAAVARAMAVLLADAVSANAAAPADPGAGVALARALAGALDDAERERDEARVATAHADARLLQLTGSRSWRVTRPLREAARRTRRV